MEPIVQFVGRLHPLVLHAPIGLLIGLAVIEIVFRIARQSISPLVRTSLVWLITLSAAASIVSGLILAREGGYLNTTLQWHQWLAIAVGAIVLISAIAHHLACPRVYGVSLAIACVLLIPVGHLGASMTHGSQFLIAPFKSRTIEPFVLPRDPESGQSQYLAVIAPILEVRCVGCHGPDRARGGLRLHTPDAILLGGDSGPALNPANPASSSLLVRMLLPLDHDDHMPPESKPQPEASEIAIIEQWVLEGASFVAVSELAQLDTSHDEQHARDPGTPPADAIDALRQSLVHVEPVAVGSNLLIVDVSTAIPPLDDERIVTLFSPLSKHIMDLSLARSNVTDAALETLRTFPHLRRLDLSATQITDAGLTQLAENKSIEVMNLSRTRNVTDESIPILRSMPKLSRVYLWGSSISLAEIIAWRESQPEVLVDAGDTPDAAEIDSVAAQGVPDDQAIARAVAQALTPINTSCPVASRPVDARFSVIHKDRVVAFCCADCLSSFVRDPDRYAAALEP